MADVKMRAKHPFQNGPELVQPGDEFTADEARAAELAALGHAERVEGEGTGERAPDQDKAPGAALPEGEYGEAVVKAGDGQPAEAEAPEAKEGQPLASAEGEAPAEDEGHEDEGGKRGGGKRGKREG